MQQQSSSSIRASAGWGALAVFSVVALGWLAPSGLLLLAFLAVVIGIHEGAHFLAARKVGIVPTEFYWGFGPEVASIAVGDCRYGVRALFIGGYVRLEGMTPSSTLPEGVAESTTFRAASVSGRLATILAGPISNVVLAVLAFAASAALAGSGFGDALVVGVRSTWSVVVATGEALGVLVVHAQEYMRAVLDMSGATAAPVRFLSPVGQADISRQAVEGGAGLSLQWLGVLSAAVAIVNALPFPPLDGGHAAVAIADGVLRRVRGASTQPVDAQKLLPVAYLTVGLLVALSMSALVLDVRDLV